MQHANKYPLINIDPVAVSIGPLDIHWYGIMYLLAFLSFWAIGNSVATRRTWWGWSRQDVSDILFYGMLGVILGGRIGYMLFYGFDLLLAEPLSIFRVWDGGMSFHGGLLGSILAMAWFARRSKKTFTKPRLSRMMYTAYRLTRSNNNQDALKISHA